MRANLLIEHKFIVAVALVSASIALASPRNGPSSGPPRTIHLRGQVLDGNNHEPLEAARITLVPGPGSSPWRTDSRGRFSFWTAVPANARIEIQCDGYQQLSLSVGDGDLRDIALSPGTVNANQPQVSRSRNLNFLLPPSPSVAPAILSADSGPKLSGTGAQWSQWYQLGAGKAPHGYTIERSDFWLSGDARCGASAQCRQISQSDQQVLWEFRLHGHEEPGAPASTYSVAHIRVLYRVTNATAQGSEY
jgi:hypothetical protein